MLGTFVDSLCDIKMNVQNCCRNLAVRGLRSVLFLFALI